MARKWKKKCPQCQGKLKNQGLRKRKIHTGRTGIIEIKRAYYTCTNASCKYTEIPLDKILKISPNYASGKFEEMICHLSAQMPFEHVCNFLESQEQIKVSETLIRNTAESCGKALLESELKQENKTEEIKTARLYVGIDGSMIPIRGKQDNQEIIEYKENKLALLFTEENIIRGQENKVKKIKQKRYVSSIGKGVEEFEKLLRKKSSQYTAMEVVTVTDGAEWIDQMNRRLFPDSIHILDWYHAQEHLWNCAKSIFGVNEESQIKKFVEPLRSLLWEGKVELVCMELLDKIKIYSKKETELRNLYSYYYTRREKMKYDKFRAKGYFIGSGSIESANKYLVQRRLKQSGMKWVIEGAHAILKLREKIYESTWIKVWNNKNLFFSY